MIDNQKISKYFFIFSNKEEDNQTKRKINLK